MQKPYITFLFIVLYHISSAQIYEGNWNAILKIEKAQLRILLNVEKRTEGYITSMMIPDQSRQVLQVDMTLINKDSFKFSMNNGAIVFRGKLNKKDSTIWGEYTQGKIKTNLKFAKRFLEKEKPKRPQEPKTPFSYYTEEVKFENKTAKIKLGGTLSLPTKNGKFPVVVLITGNGSQNRNDEIMGHKPFLVLSDYLTKNGVAVLRYDDRGVDSSEGNPMKCTSADFATDAESAVAYLKTRNEIDHSKIGLIGHSEGGMIATMIAAKSSDVSYVVLMAGSGVPGHLLLLSQNIAMSKAYGSMNENDIEKSNTRNKEIYNIVMHSENSDSMKVRMSVFYKNTIMKDPNFHLPKDMTEDSLIIKETNKLDNPWIKFFLTYDPAFDLMNIKCPVFAINGDKDVQVVAVQNLNGIEYALSKAKNEKFSQKRYPNLNHLFQECKYGVPQEYGDIEQTISPIVLEDILKWVKDQIQNK